MPPPLITLEEHFLSSAAPPSLTALYSEQLKHIPSVHTKLLSLSTTRLTDMAAGGIALQVVSHVPGLTSPSACRAANDQLSEAIRSQDHPQNEENAKENEDGTANTNANGKEKVSASGNGNRKLAAFAVTPMSDPPSAASELRRAVTQLGFVGALVDNTTASGSFFDSSAYDPFWTTAEDLNVPIYLHPTWASGAQLERYRGNFSEAAAQSMASSGMGWHSETGLHVLRLFASGLFDKRPGLKIIIGHMGEMIPFMLDRIQVLSKRWGEYRRDFKTVYRENIWITTSGVWSIDPMRCILANTAIDHILYSVDYPFQKNEVGLEWMRELGESGLVNQEQLKAIAYGNAEKLLGITAPKKGSS